MTVKKTKELSDRFAAIVRFHRKRSGLSQSELARLAGVGKTVVFDLEHSKPSIQLDTLVKILNVLNISLEPQSPLMLEFGEKKGEL